MIHELLERVVSGEVLKRSEASELVRAIMAGEVLGGVSNYGVRPTIGGGLPVLETHLFGYSGDAYGQQVEVIPVAHLREEREFSSLGDLKTQIADDARRARELIPRKES